MTRLLPLLALILLLAGAAAAAPRDGEIERITSSGAAARAHWGVHAVVIETGEVLADINEERLFIPASTRKLVPSALAVRHLAADETLQTVVHAASAPVAGTVSGDLVLRAVGDPTWNAETGGLTGRSRLNRLARQVAEAGVTRVDGDLVIDTSRFLEPAPMPPAWNWEDFQTSYGSIPSVLGIDRNLARVEIGPGSPGTPPRVQLGGDAMAFEVVNDATTARAGAAPTLQLFRGLDGTRLMLTGQMAADAAAGARSIPMGDPVRVAAEEFLAALREAGITVRGGVRMSGSSIPQGEVLGVLAGAPVSAILERVNEDSDNYLAESLYLLAGAKVYARGSYEASHKAEEAMWKALKVDPTLCVPADGSGLSRKNHVAPRAVTALLVAMAEEEAFTSSLAVAGHTGTLRYRLGEQKLAGRVRAKTGTLDGVAALAGYATRNNGQTVAFCIMANNYTTSASPIRSRIDEIVGVLAR